MLICQYYIFQEGKYQLTHNYLSMFACRTHFCFMVMLNREEILMETKYIYFMTFLFLNYNL